MNYQDGEPHLLNFDWGVGEGEGEEIKQEYSSSLSPPANWSVGHLEMQNPFTVSAIATIEPKYLVLTEDADTQTSNLPPGANSSSKILDSSSEESSDLDEREKLRRSRISKSNKGNVPWNKGRKHSAETIQRIRERTRLAMQDPKVNRLVILFQRKNLIAEASRNGYTGDEELQWDSFEILDKQLENEWLEISGREKSKTILPDGRKAPKPLEHRRKIAETISAKWADPEYRERVRSGLAKYHGSIIRPERKPRRKPTGEMPSVRRGTKKQRATEQGVCARAGRSLGGVVSQRKIKTPSYKDPLAKSKLEMIKKIREQRVVMQAKKRETMERAKLLIAEAEKAAKALEVAAKKSALAQASLTETRKLIAKATHSIQSIETGHLTLSSNTNFVSFESNGVINHFHEALKTTDMSSIPQTREVNGTHAFSSSNNRSISDANLDKHAPKKSVNGIKSMPVFQNAEGAEDYFLPQFYPDHPRNQLSMTSQLVDPHKINGAEGKLVGVVAASESKSSSSDSPKKKWVCGRLVEVSED
ncbi:hypothetical protein ACLOJK_025111 [Asimina triloba]